MDVSSIKPTQQTIASYNSNPDETEENLSKKRKKGSWVKTALTATAVGVTTLLALNSIAGWRRNQDLKSIVEASDSLKRDIMNEPNEQENSGKVIIYKRDKDSSIKGLNEDNSNISSLSFVSPVAFFEDQIAKNNFIFKINHEGEFYDIRRKTDGPLEWITNVSSKLFLEGTGLSNWIGTTSLEKAAIEARKVESS